MGAGRFEASDWDAYTTRKHISKESKSSEIYTSHTVKEEFEPLKIDIRESCDSAEHPNSTPIILGLDVTGSMSSVLETIAKKLNVLLEEIYTRKPVPDPQVMFLAFGDVECDSHPLQATQFESDIRIAEQLSGIYFERGGGGNYGESYSLPWYFASRHTKIDSFEKHGKKGILFTMGDEPCLKTISKEHIKEFVGDNIQDDLTAEQLLNEVSRQYEVYHLIIKEGSNMRYDRGDAIVEGWKDLLGQRVIIVEDCDKLPEIIVSILEIMAGKDSEEVIDSWDKTTALTVKTAINGLQAVKADDKLVEF